MSYSDTLTGLILARIQARIDTTEGSHVGIEEASHNISESITDGATSNKATGFFSSSFVATTGGITVSLADDADPLGGAGSDAPTSDPEGLKLKAILIENQDATNFVSVKKGTNGEASILSGSTDSIKIDPGGCVLWFSPAGNNAMNDGTDDELLFTADTASVTVKLTYLYG